MVLVRVRVRVRLTVPRDLEAEGRPQRAHGVVGADVQAVQAGRAEGVAQPQAGGTQQGQRAARLRVRGAVPQEPPTNPHGRTGHTARNRVRKQNRIPTGGQVLVLLTSRPAAGPGWSSGSRCSPTAPPAGCS